MIEYTKIDTIFARNIDGSKALIEGKYKSDAVEFLKDARWSCTEKVDGTNIGVVWDGHRVSFQGRTERAQIPADLVNALNRMFGGMENEELFEQKFGCTPVILFGEGYGGKIQGGKYRKDASFILFDVFMPNDKGGIWLKRDAIEDIAKAFGIEAVPVVLVGTLDDAVAFVKSRPKSTLGDDPMEGVVCKPAVDLLDRMGRRLIVKVKAKDFPAA